MKKKTPKAEVQNTEPENPEPTAANLREYKGLPLPIWIMMFAGIACLFIYGSIRLNVIDYTTLPAQVTIKVPNSSLSNSAYSTFTRKVTSQLPLDTIGTKPSAASKKNKGTPANNPDSTKVDSTIADGTTEPLPANQATPVDSQGKAFVRAAGPDIKPVAALKNEGELIDEVAMHQNPSFLVWIMLILIMVSIAGGSLPVFLYFISLLKHNFSLKDKTKGAWVFAIAVLIFMIITSFGFVGYYDPVAILGKFNILLECEWLPPFIVGLTASLMCPSFAVVYLIALAAGKLPFIKAASVPTNENPDEKTKIKLAATQFELLHGLLKQILQLHAVIVVFAVLTSNSLGKSIRSVLSIEDFDLFPKEVPYVYGMFFSLFLCALYIPTYMYLKTCYQSYMENLEKNGVPEDDKNIMANMAKTIKLDNGLVENIKLALTLLSPLLSLLLPDGVNLFK